ncbi:MAG TPA: class I SAM-dependent methyltransferase [Caulobacteraceae bacterium]|nr:class I SAM-dependent methyltransferase [Caulobacteraceae bacterium]
MPSTTPVNRYGSIAAEIYDIDKPFGALDDTAFHLERLQGVEGPILEPACGSGRTLIPLLQAGHTAAGFDLSEDMLARCRARCQAAGFSPELKRASFEDFAYDRSFAAILVPVGSFGLIDDFARSSAVLDRFRACLAPGGLLILDVQPVSNLAARGEDLRSWTAASGDLLTVDGKTTRRDWLGQRLERRVVYERWREGTLIESQIEPMALRYWGVEEMRLLLAARGFAEIGVSGGYERRAPRDGDAMITFEAVRA